MCPHFCCDFILTNYNFHNVTDNCNIGLDPEWHMIIGGIKYPSELSSVELYNWKTGEKCQLVI